MESFTVYLVISEELHFKSNVTIPKEEYQQYPLERMVFCPKSNAPDWKARNRHFYRLQNWWIHGIIRKISKSGGENGTATDHQSRIKWRPKWCWNRDHSFAGLDLHDLFVHRVLIFGQKDGSRNWIKSHQTSIHSKNIINMSKF